MPDNAEQKPEKIKSAKRKPNIMAFLKNQVGKDYVCGDIHGKLALLKGVHAQLGPNDRLLLLGDLVDRGEDSLGVLRFIEETNEDPTKAKISSIQGNHEQLFVDRADYMLGRGDKKNLVLHDRNGGLWANELQEDDLKKTRNMVNNLQHIFLLVDETDIKKSIAMVHAAMPIGDEELFARLNDDNPYPYLTPSEKRYATWARPPGSKGDIDIQKILGRDESSILALAGHNVNGEVRKDENTVVLDTGSWISNSLMLLNTTDMECTVYSPDPENMPRSAQSQKVLNEVRRIQNDINTHINKDNPNRDIQALNKYIVIEDFLPKPEKVETDELVEKESVIYNLELRLVNLIQRYHADRVQRQTEDGQDITTNKHLAPKPFFTALLELAAIIDDPTETTLNPVVVLENIVEHLENSMEKDMRRYFGGESNKYGFYNQNKTAENYIQYINNSQDTYLQTLAVTLKELYQIYYHIDNPNHKLDKTQFRVKWADIMNDIKPAEDFGLKTLIPSDRVAPVNKPTT